MSVYLWTWNRGLGLGSRWTKGLRFLDTNPEGGLNVSVQIHVNFIWKAYDTMSKETHSVSIDKIMLEKPQTVRSRKHFG